MAPTGDWTLTLLEAVHQVILREAGAGQAVDALAAALRSGDHLASYLETLIGVAGAHALRQRSITLTTRAHPWLADVPSPPGTLLQPAGLARAERQEPGAVTQSSLALLINFVNLLVSFIGERLTVQVLCQAWPEVAPLLRKKESL